MDKNEKNQSFIKKEKGNKIKFEAILQQTHNELYHSFIFFFFFFIIIIVEFQLKLVLSCMKVSFFFPDHKDWAKV